MAKKDDLKIFTKTFGILLKKQREQSCLSQEANSLKAGVHRQWLSKIENGDTLPTVFSFYNYAKAIGLDIPGFLQKVFDEYERETAPAKIAAEHNQGLDYFKKNKKRKAAKD